MKFFCVYEEILFIRPTIKDHVWKMYVPAATEVALIQDYHERYGHMGSLKVIKALSEHCYVKAINKRVREIVKTCNICQLVKVNNEKRMGAMITIKSNKKLEKTFLDICGPFPRSGGRHKYKYIILFDHYTKYTKLYAISRLSLIHI